MNSKNPNPDVLDAALSRDCRHSYGVFQYQNRLPKYIQKRIKNCVPQRPKIRVSTIKPVRAASSTCCFSIFLITVIKISVDAAYFLSLESKTGAKSTRR